MKKSAPSNTDSTIDSRDVIAHIAELESELEDLLNGFHDAQDCVENNRSQEAIAAMPELEELATLQKLAEEVEQCADGWQYGATLINVGYFAKYCEELVKDIGDLPAVIPDYLVIDWDATADNLKADYTEIDFDGTTFYVR